MVSAFQKFILWCAATIAISFMTVYILYRMAWILSIMGLLLLFGFVVGMPVVLVLRSKVKREVKKYMREHP